jgi:hydroxymethylbilane synthase
VAVPERAAPGDVLVGSSLNDLPAGAMVGTGSPRRAEQLLELRPDVRPVAIRGNIDTRLNKVATRQVAALVIAEAALQRLGATERISHRFSTAEMVPAPGQGALAVEAKRGSAAATLAQEIDDLRLREAVSAERMLLAETGAGCRAALGALAMRGSTQLRMNVFLSDERGRRRVVGQGETPDAVVADVRKGLGT